MKKIITLLAIAFYLDANAQIITTVAGNGTQGSYGNGGAATSAELYWPDGVAIDPSGNLYIADRNNSSIRKVNGSGIISNFAGTGTNGYTGDGGQASAAELHFATGVSSDASGNIYIADYSNNRIRKVNASGIISTIAGNGTAGISGDGGQATAAEFDGPYGVAFDASGNMYIPDAWNNRIRKVTPSGVISTVAGYTISGGYSGDGGQATAAKLYGPTGVAFDASGNMYIADASNERIRKVSVSGIISTFAGTGTATYSGDGGQASAAALNYPASMVFDASGNLYVGDMYNNRIRKITPAGIISTVVGNGTAAHAGDGGLASAAELNQPQGLVFDASGNLYISDYSNNVVRKVTPPLTLTLNSSTICAGATTTLTATGATSYTWSPATGLSATTGSMVTANPSSTTTYTVIGANGAAMGLVTSVVTVNSLPTVTANASATVVCAGTNITLTGGGTATSYTWTGGITNAVAFAASSTQTYTVTGTDGNGCVNSATKAITVNPLPTVTANATATMVCAGTNITLTGGGTATSYTWTGGITNGTPFAASSSQNYTVTGSDANGCINTATKVITVNPLPTVTANATATLVCAGTNITLTGGGANTYTWSGGITDGTPFAASSSQNYTVIGTDGNGCTNTASKTITVNALPTVTANATASLVCAGTIITLTGSGANTYTWSGGITNGTPFSASSTQTYTVIGTDANGCVNTATKGITVNSLPIVTANSTVNNFCTGSGGVVLTGGGAMSYTWTGGVTDGTAFVPSTTNTYTVTGTDANGCKNTAVKTITVSNPPTVYANATNTSICVGDSVTLTGSGALTYTWTGSVIDGMPFAPNTSHTYNVAGTDANGCVNTASVSIVVNALPTANIIATNTAVCPGTSVTLTAFGNASSYVWLGSISNGVAFVPSTTTTYSVTGIGSNGCTKTATKTIIVNPLPTVTAVANPTVTCAGMPVTLTANGASTYTWSTTATTATIVVSPTVTTTYTVTGTDANSCKNSTTVIDNILANLAPEICLVTTDSATNYQYNIVYWQNSLYGNADSFIVYRYSSGSYLVLGTVSKDSTRFIDANRNIGGPNGGDPNVSGWQYKLAIKDTCGNTSPMSPYHFTSNFQQNNQNLSWSPYQIQSPQSNPLNGYQVLRDSLGINDFHVFANTSYLTTSTQDPNYALYPNANYRVDALGFNCTSNQRLASGGNNNIYGIRQKSHSNTNRQAGQTTNINQVAGSKYQVAVYPNPSNGMFTIKLNNYENTSVEVYNAIGQKVLTQALQTNITALNLADFSNGVYQLRVLKNNALVYQTKISKVD